MKEQKININTERQINEFARELGLVILDLSLHGAAGNKVLEVITDNENEGVSLELLTTLSRKINEFIDENETGIIGNFRLEVTSPGVDYPLKHEWQFRKNVGRLLLIKYKDSIGNQVNGLFRLLDIDNSDLIVVEHKPSPKGHKAKLNDKAEGIRLLMNCIERAVVEVEF